MQKITSQLWFDTQAKEAAEFYVSTFPDSKIISSITLHNTPSGDVDSLVVKIMDHEFGMMSAGPLFKINPSVSYFVNFDPSKDSQAKQHLDELWAKLSEGGSALMPLQKYPFSEWYGWVQDKYGVSWQLILTNPDGPARPHIVPSMMFVGAVNGTAEEALQFYTSVFKDATAGTVAKYPAGAPNDQEGNVMFSDFQLEGQWFAAMDGGKVHDFAFNEATSFMVKCEDQAEIDYYWDKLIADGGQESVCGWLKDKYGFSWQVAPKAIDKMMSSGTPEQIDRVTQSFLKMKKFDVAELQRAYEGN